MRGNGMISGYSVFFKGVRDWRSFDISIMERLIAIEFIFGSIATLLKNKYIFAMFELYSMVVFVYFIICPVVIYHRNFRTEECRYIYLTPIKKNYVLLKSLWVWAVGFSVFTIARMLIRLMTMNIPLPIDFIYILLVLFNSIIFILGIYAVIISTDIITVVKNIPRIVTYPIAALIIFCRGFIPDFLMYSSFSNFDALGLISGGFITINSLVQNVVIGPNLVVFILGLVLFIYALSIFEGYNGERVRFFKK